MRSYFDFNLKGRRIFPYVIAGWIVIAAVAVLYCFWLGAHPVPSPFFDKAFFASQAVSIAAGLLMLIASLLVAFFTVTFTIRAISLRGEGFTCEHNFRDYLWIVVKGSLLTLVTLGIYFPWLVTKVMRYFASNTYFRYNEFRFDGSAMNLFAVMVIFVVLPAVLMSVAFSSIVLYMISGSALPVWFYVALAAAYLISAMFVSLYIKWFINFSYGPKRITAAVKFWHSTWFLFGQILLLIVTAGLYTPMFILRTYRYYVGRLVLGDETVEDRFGFSMSPWKDYFYVLGQLFLTVVTIGIYGAWAYTKVATRLFSRSFVEVVEEQKIPMPETD